MNKSETFQFYSSECINLRENIYYCSTVRQYTLFVQFGFDVGNGGDCSFLSLCLSSIACLLFSYFSMCLCVCFLLTIDFLVLFFNFFSSPKNILTVIVVTNSTQSTIYHYGNLFQANIYWGILFVLLLSPLRFNLQHSTQQQQLQKQQTTTTKKISRKI